MQRKGCLILSKQKEIHACAIRFVREIVQARKRPTRKDVENFVEMLRKKKISAEDMNQLEQDLDENLQGRIEFFRKNQNKAKEEEYKQVRFLMSKFFDFYKEKIQPK